MRLTLLALTVVAINGRADRPDGTMSRAWPLRARLSSISGKTTGFRAVTLGGELIIRDTAAMGRRTANPLIPVIARLGPTDTLHSTTPADFPMDLRNGGVLFL